MSEVQGITVTVSLESVTGRFSLLAIITRMPDETYRWQFVLLLFSCYRCDVKPALYVESFCMSNFSVQLNLLVRWSLLKQTFMCKVTIRSPFFLLLVAVVFKTLLTLSSQHEFFYTAFINKTGSNF